MENKRYEEIINSIVIIANKKNETPEKIYKELRTNVEKTIQFERKYRLLDEKEKYRKRPDRNELFENVSKELSQYSYYRKIYNYPITFRPHERGKNINEFLINMVCILKELNSQELIKILSEIAI